MERHDYGILFKHIHDALYKQSNNRLRESNLTLTQMGLMTNLERQPGGRATMKELERLLHVAQSTVVGIVSRLEQKKYVESCESTDDRRVKIVYLTEEGQEKCRQSQKFMEHDDAQLVKGFSEQEKEEFYQLLLRVQQNIREQ